MTKTTINIGFMQYLMKYKQEAERYKLSYVKIDLCLAPKYIVVKVKNVKRAGTKYCSIEDY